MHQGQSAEDRLLSAIEMKNAAARRVALEHTEEAARACLVAILEEAELRGAVMARGERVISLRNASPSPHGSEA